MFPRSVFRILDRLKKAGKLRIDSGGGRHQTNRYTIVVNPDLKTGVNPDPGTPPDPETLFLSARNPVFGVPPKTPDPSGTVIEPKKKKIAASPLGSEHQKFIRGWTDNFRAHFGFAYSFNDGRDGKAVQGLLKTKIPESELLELGKQAWAKYRADPKAWNCKQAVTLYGFRDYLNQIRAELKNGTHQPDNKRNHGIARAGPDYGEAAKRKLERQMAAAQNRQPSQAGGNGA